MEPRILHLKQNHPLTLTILMQVVYGPYFEVLCLIQYLNSSWHPQHVVIDFATSNGAEEGEGMVNLGQLDLAASTSHPQRPPL
jgi:hypothetical protein